MPSSTIAEKKERLPVLVEKPIPLEFDMGNLCAFDTNPLDPTTYSSSLEECLNNAARDCAQALINQVLTTLPMKSAFDGVYAELPDPVTPLPREKPLPKAKEPTKWELFAKKKGIKAKTKDGKLVYDEEKGEWVPKWGYKGKNKDDEGDWIVEVDGKKERERGEDRNPRALSREERKDRIKKNERQMKKNEKRAVVGGKSLAIRNGRVGKR
ncbi:ribosomal biogenesis regulatory protein [Tuber borchii]|uniref:Ribosome biogenesis regulatory protein n=1 Tax=Tuber borchii TaxID=42251 RepID=A0A2T6ZZS1_TUBBO|nr:ribosomal biogenesis regulatory protein [Tuber borchii]